MNATAELSSVRGMLTSVVGVLRPSTSLGITGALNRTAGERDARSSSAAALRSPQAAEPRFPLAPGSISGLFKSALSSALDPGCFKAGLKGLVTNDAAELGADRLPAVVAAMSAVRPHSSKNVVGRELTPTHVVLAHGTIGLAASSWKQLQTSKPLRSQPREKAVFASIEPSARDATLTSVQKVRNGNR